MRSSTRRPPAISDEDMSDGENGLDVIPTKREKKPVKYADPKKDADDDNDDKDGGAANDEEDEGDDEEDGDEYIVEKIISHMIAEDGNPRFEVKWEGFDKKEDRTWEPEDNLRGTADTILDDYLNKFGGMQGLYKAGEKATKGKKRGRPSTSGAPSSTKKSRANGGAAVDSDASETRKPGAWKPPAGSWEDQIDHVDMTRDTSGDLIVWLTWKNGEKSQHKAQQAYTRAPQKMLKFYESKINFTTST
ncbi:heterochromatin protein one [Gaeumannomyces tritici R3-111a-1]|uniref:Heterochromatin protein one n=1 Tax=Gaeumannomyces tritici (strain R3-111a-1) TaxID=644352 RepID=J3NH93_GAET3|nr:heterochromatin protein one [Gaeumannomyces tritici R3-111a-1]EJT80636.1 heterochromatin protein one [Gaeumannomyces tritici R3-111a-1]